LLTYLDKAKIKIITMMLCTLVSRLFVRLSAVCVSCMSLQVEELKQP